MRGNLCRGEAHAYGIEKVSENLRRYAITRHEKYADDIVM